MHVFVFIIFEFKSLTGDVKYVYDNKNVLKGEPDNFLKLKKKQCSSIRSEFTITLIY